MAWRVQLAGTGAAMSNLSLFGIALLRVGLPASIAAFILVGLSRHYALRNALLDIPNERSSHTVPTPRGGGIGIAVVCLAAVAWCTIRGALPFQFAMAVLVGGGIVAAVGWIDDHRDIAASHRAVAQLVAVALALYWLGGYPVLQLGILNLQLGVWGFVAATVAVCWLINLFNFMDGSDGLAGVQGICTATMGGFLLASRGATELSVVSLIVAGACGGFLVWNWAPAKIFMGDAGSYLLGMIFGLLAVTGENQQVMPAFTWVILLSVFICDATFTLVWRIATGKSWLTAHKDHAYQRLIQLGYKHQQVALAVAAVNVVVLWPLSWLVVAQPTAILPIALMTSAIMFVAWWWIQRRFRLTSGE